MRYAAGHKEQTRAKILRAAGRVFRRQGYHAAGVDKVMEEAGLTAGGFYAHFGSKEALLAETLGPAAAEAGAARDKDLEGVAGDAWVEAFVERYLSPGHRHKTEDGLPAPGAGLRDRAVRRSGQGELRGDRPRSRRPAPGPRGRGPRGRSCASRSSPSASVGSGLRDRSRTRPSASASSPPVATWPEGGTGRRRRVAGVGHAA